MASVIRRWARVRSVARSRMATKFPQNYTLLRIPTSIHLYRFGNATSPLLSRIRPKDMILTPNGDLKSPPYSGWEAMTEKPGIATFSKPMFTTGYVWRLTVQSSPKDVYVVRDMVYEFDTPRMSFVNHWSWLPKKDVSLKAFAKESDVPNTWVRLPKSAMLPDSPLRPVPDVDIMGKTQGAIAQALHDKIEAMEQRAKQLGESDEALFLDEDMLLYKHYYNRFLRDCAQMYENTQFPPIAFGLDVMCNKCPGQQSTRFYSTNSQITSSIPLSSVVVDVVREHIKQLETRLQELKGENNIDSRLDIEDMVRALNNVVHNGFVGLSF